MMNLSSKIKLKCRNHVNPLDIQYQIPVQLDALWKENNFVNPANPYIVDIGAAKGTWALKYGMANPQYNIVGLEIRRPVVAYALQRRDKWNVKNVHFLSCNANVDLNNILASINTKSESDSTSETNLISMITIQFPDPCFKNKHRKRRVVNSDLITTIANHIAKGTNVFLQSDILEVEQDMVTQFNNHNNFFVPAINYDIANLEKNISPFDVQTEREISTLGRGLPVYRMMFTKI
jgi:tRNA (guanine-N7-)-methyltransferase